MTDSIIPLNRTRKQSKRRKSVIVDIYSGNYFYAMPIVTYGIYDRRTKKRPAQFIIDDAAELRHELGLN